MAQNKWPAMLGRSSSLSCQGLECGRSCQALVFDLAAHVAAGGSGVLPPSSHRASCSGIFSEVHTELPMHSLPAGGVCVKRCGRDPCFLFGGCWETDLSQCCWQGVRAQRNQLAFFPPFPPRLGSATMSLEYAYVYSRHPG